MANFYVYWNAVVRKIKIHRSECGACKGGKGMHEGKIGEARGKTDGWDSAETYQEARDCGRPAPYQDEPFKTQGGY